MTEILLGTQGWYYGSWVGPFYPEGVRGAEMLSYYSRAFPTVEVDATFYAVPASPVVDGWRERVPAGFKFALKLPQAITHERRLEDAAEPLGRFLSRAAALGEHLGPVLIQLSPAFKPTGEHRSRLAAFLGLLPADTHWAVEFRDEGWLDDDTLTLLARHGIALALVDGRWLRRQTVLALCEHPTARYAYVRWMGSRRRFTDFSRVQETAEPEMDQWRGALAGLRERVDTIYGYVNNNLQGHAPHSARTLQQLVGIQPVEPGALRSQRELF